MTPSWKFKSVSPANPSLRPFNIRPWPDDLPDKCGVCGKEFRYGWNLTIGPGKIGRIMRATAYFGFLPCLVIGIILPGIFPEIYFSVRKPWWLFFFMMFGPPFILGGLSVVMPGSRLVHCKKCGWKRDFPLPKIPPIPTSDKDSSEPDS